MQKLVLSLDDLSVDTFATPEEPLLQPVGPLANQATTPNTCSACTCILGCPETTIP